MIKKTIATLGLLLTSLSPSAIAAPTQAEIDQHIQLINMVDSIDNIQIGVNITEICNKYGFHGAYKVVDGKGYLIICQDNRSWASSDIVEWTDNDLDTIRHEIFHYVQDCADGKIDFNLRQVYDSIDGVIEHNIERALGISQTYSQRLGVRSSQNLFLEFEAFHAADTETAAGIADDVVTYCLQ